LSQELAFFSFLPHPYNTNWNLGCT